MNILGFAAVTANFLLIGLLPVVFFKRNGRLNFRWWLTATPFLLSVGSVIASLLGYIQSNSHTLPVIQQTLGLLAMALSLGSIFLIALTLGSHRIPIALWHQNNDAPQHIVTWGAYSRIRHPFYTSFLLTFLAAFCFCPQPCTFIALVFGALVLNATAAREERTLSHSAFGDTYRQYMSYTGRFLPKLGGSHG